MWGQLRNQGLLTIRLSICFRIPTPQRLDVQQKQQFRQSIGMARLQRIEIMSTPRRMHDSFDERHTIVNPNATRRPTNRADGPKHIIGKTRVDGFALVLRDRQVLIELHMPTVAELEIVGLPHAEATDQAAVVLTVVV